MTEEFLLLADVDQTADFYLPNAMVEQSEPLPWWKDGAEIVNIQLISLEERAENRSDATWFDDAKLKVRELKELPDTWSQYESAKPSAWAIDMAEKGLHCIAELGMGAPHIAASEEEGVVLSFNKGKATGNIEFFNTREIVAAFSRGFGEPEVWELGCKKADIFEAFTRIKAFLDSI